MEDNEARSEEDRTSKQTHVQLVNKEPSDFWFHQVLRCFRVVWSQFWTSSKCLSTLESTTNNQAVKIGLYRLQNVNNFSEGYIRMCLTCRSLAEFFNFIGLVELQQYIYSIFINISDHSRLINSNILQRKSLIFCCVLKDFDLINLSVQYRRPGPHNIGLDSGVRNRGIPTS